MASDLRELIRENDQRAYDFCVYMLQGIEPVDVFFIRLFGDFAIIYEKSLESALRNKKNPVPGEEEANLRRLFLFKYLWSCIQGSALRTSTAPSYSYSGRDMRTLRQADENLLAIFDEENKSEILRSEAIILERLARIDFQLRAPLVLHDILGFSDENTAEILGLRWSVYRHRLHRGRTDFKDALKGWALNKPHLSTESSVGTYGN